MGTNNNYFSMMSNPFYSATNSLNRFESNSSLSPYMSDTDLQKLIATGQLSSNITTSKKLYSTRINGIEGLPYQFLPNVDARLTGTELGRKYAERIFARLPLLFLTPCEPQFMADFNKDDRQTFVQALGGAVTNVEDLTKSLKGNARYYATKFAYDEYYKYLNTMLAAVAAYLGIFYEEVPIGDRSSKAIGKIDWRKEMNEDFKTFFSAGENVIFYMDGLNTVSESFSNSTTQSSLASLVNGFSEQANEIRFLFGNKGNAVADLVSKGTEVTSTISQSLSSLATGVGGGIVGSLAQNGVNTVLNGGKIVFPEIWADSTYDKSYSIDIKLRSPDHDSLSIFLNVLKPYCKLLCMTLPRQAMMGKKYDANGYNAPFLVRAYSKGMFNVDMGMISSMTVTKGAECQWNDDGLPTQIDISLDIVDLYKSLFISKASFADGIGFTKDITGVISNTAYMDFLANMAGLNVAQMEMGRKGILTTYLLQSAASRTPTEIFATFDNNISNLIGQLYNIL